MRFNELYKIINEAPHTQCDNEKICDEKPAIDMIDYSIEAWSVEPELKKVYMRFLMTLLYSTPPILLDVCEGDKVVADQGQDISHLMSNSTIKAVADKVDIDLHQFERDIIANKHLIQREQD